MMKKIFLLVIGFVMFKMGYSQYPIQQFIGADSAVVTSKGGLQGRLINHVFTDTTSANSQRIKQYPGAMIYASGKLWVRNTTATGWTELAYGPISTTNIYNSDGTLTGNRELDGNSNNLTFTAVKKFEFSGDSLYYLLDPAGNLRLKLGNQQFTMQGDTASLSRRLSYTANLGSSFTKHSLVDKNYVDSIGVLSPTGSGTTNYVSKWTGSTALGNSQIFDNGTSVGIGTASPSSKLHVEGGTLTVIGSGTSVNEFRANGIIAIDLTPNLSDDYKFRTLVAVSGDITQTAVNNFSLNSGGYLGLGGGGSEKMRITSAGRVLIGTQTESTYELDVVGDIRSTLDANINGLTVGKGGGNVADNTAFGYQAINGTSTGTSNTAIGYIALKSLTSGSYNSALGLNAGNSLTTGNQNVFLGSYAGGSFTTQSNNVAIGYYSMVSATSSDFNTAIGHSAFQNTTSAGGGVAVGYQSLNANTSGDYNTGIGYQSLRRNTTGAYNTAIGHRTLDAAISATGNTSIGWASLINATGGYNTAIGKNAGYSTTTGTYNIFIGSDPSLSSGNGITTGNYNTIIGSQITGLSSSLSNTIILADGQGNQRLYINNIGNLGVNTTSPTSLGSNITTLDIVGRSDAFTGGIYFRSSANAVRGYIYGTSSLFTIGSETSVPLTFQTAATEQARIFANGNFAIGTTTDGGYKLQVSGTTQTTALRISNGSVVCDNTFISDAFVLGGSTNLWFYNNSSKQIKANGTDITVYTTVPQLNTQTTFVINDAGSAPTGYKIQKWMTGSVEKAFLDKDGNFTTLTSGLFGSIGTVNASAVLEATSTTKGFLPPRQTQAQRTAITSPAVGLIVYQTDATEGLYIYTSTGWVQL